MADEIAVAAPAVSPATEASAPADAPSSDPGTQAAATESAPQADTPTAAPAASERPDYARLLKEDAELQKLVNAQVQKTLAKERQRQLREQASRAVENEDADTALSIARQIASEQEDEADEEHDSPRAIARRSSELAKDTAFVADPDYRLAYETDRDLVAKQFRALPLDEFRTWARSHGRQLAIKAEAQKVAATLARGMATEQVNQALASVPVPPGGQGGTAGALTLERWEQMSRSERDDIRRNKPNLYDDLVARAAR